jgi:hypothetical protein
VQRGVEGIDNPPVFLLRKNSGAVRHSDKLPEKTLFSLILRQKSSKSAKDFCGFSLSQKNHHSFQVLRSFELATFSINKQQNSRNANAFREFFVQLIGKGAVQNHYITMGRCPYKGACFISGK